jgi:tripartite-type tricarboxylate transporter receptor subunit TctC
MKKLLIVLSFIICSTASAGESYKIFVPNPPGSGGGDSISRKLAELYQQRTGNTLNVINVAGGGHIPAVHAFKKEPHSAIIMTTSMLVYKTVPDDQLGYTDADFAIVSELGEIPNYYFTSAKSNIRTAKDLITVLPQSKKPFIGFQSPQTMINIRALSKYRNVTIDPIGFKGLPDMLVNTLNNNVDVSLGAIANTAVVDNVRLGTIRLIAHTGSTTLKIENRMIPSLSQELQVPQFNGHLWLGVSAGDEKTKFALDLKEIIRSSEMQKFLVDMLVFPTANDPWPYINHLRSNIEKNQDLLKQ